MNTSSVPTTIRLTMAQALVRYLQTQYSERDGKTRRLIPAMFGIFGHGNVCGMGQALEECGRELPYYQPCNEQSMVHTAIGFAKANLRLATLACTSSIGPGSTNMITGAAAATINRLPGLLLPSEYYATRHQGPVLQQLEHPVSADVSVNDCFRPVSRFFDRITRPEQLLTALPEAMRVLTDPVETGTVTIALPQDIQAHAFDYPANFFARHIALCLDTGHHAYRGGDPIAFFRRHHARIPYLHLKSVDPRKQEWVERERIPFAIAVANDMFCEPSVGAVDFLAFRDALREVDYDGLATVEQDMYPAPFGKPLPIATRTRDYLRAIGLG